jgi:hypothetical protein
MRFQGGAIALLPFKPFSRKVKPHKGLTYQRYALVAYQCYVALLLEGSMNELIKHLTALLAEDKLCFQSGDWNRLEMIRLAIDDTREQIKLLQLKREVNHV